MKRYLIPISGKGFLVNKYKCIHIDIDIDHQNVKGFMNEVKVSSGLVVMKLIVGI